jgi:hypothetical protein
VIVCAAAPVHVAARQAAETLPLQLARMRSVLGNRRLGDVLVARGALTPAQRRTLLDLQAARKDGWIRLGELAMAEGYLTEAQLAEALDHRREAAEAPAHAVAAGPVG